MHTCLLKSYLPIIAIASLSFISCNKNGKNITPKPIDTAEIISHIGGVRNWKGTSSSSSQSGSSSHEVTDVFEIKPFRSAIQAKGINMYLDGLDTSSKTASFRYSPNGGIQSYYYSVTYYYGVNSIEYFEASNTGVSHQSTLELHTY